MSAGRSPSPVRRWALLGAALSVGVLLGSCGSAAAPAPGSAQVRMELSDAGCAPQPASVPAGPVTVKLLPP